MMKNLTEILPLVLLFAITACCLAIQLPDTAAARQPTPCYRATEGPYFLGTQDCQRPLPLTPGYCPFPQQP